MGAPSQKPVFWAIGIATAILLIAGFIGVASVNSNLALASQAFSNIEIPTEESISAAVLADIVIPSVDNEKLDRVCELTDGCEYWEPYYSKQWVDKVLDEKDDIEDVLLDLLKLDDDDLDTLTSFDGYNINGLFDVDVKDTQVRAYDPEFKGPEGNWEVKIFTRVTYQDVDEDNDDHEYVVITSVFDEGEYDELSVEEVSRNFEF